MLRKLTEKLSRPNRNQSLPTKVSPELAIIDDVWHQIVDEAEDHPDVETGGVMAGVSFEDKAVALAVGRGGDQAIREPGRFSGDPQVDAEAIAEARQTFGSRVFAIGMYHKHPDGMSRYSPTDVRQAQELARFYGDGRLLLVAIITKIDGEWKLFVYGLNHPDESLRPISYGMIASEDPLIQEFLDHAPVVPDVRDGGYWSDIDFGFVSNSVGQERLRQELSDLDAWSNSSTDSTIDSAKSLPGVEVYRVEGRRDVYVQVPTASGVFDLALPPEFPLGTPQLLRAGTGMEVFGLATLSQWNSSRSLREVLIEACGREGGAM